MTTMRRLQVLDPTVEPIPAEAVIAPFRGGSRVG